MKQIIKNTIMFVPLTLACACLLATLGVLLAAEWLMDEGLTKEEKAQRDWDAQRWL